MILLVPISNNKTNTESLDTEIKVISFYPDNYGVNYCYIDGEKFPIKTTDIGYNLKADFSGEWVRDEDGTLITNNSEAEARASILFKDAGMSYIVLYPACRVLVQVDDAEFGLWDSDNNHYTGKNGLYTLGIYLQTVPEIKLSRGGQKSKVKLHFQNKPKYINKDFTILYHYSVEKDNFGNFKYFSTESDIDGLSEKINTSTDVKVYYEDKETGTKYVPDGYSYLTITSNLIDLLRRKMLDADPKIPVIQLNIKCDMKLVQTNGRASSTGSGELSRWEAFMTANLGYYLTQIALTFSEVLDFIKHKQTLVPALTIEGDSLDLVDLTKDSSKLSAYLNKIEDPTEEDLKYPKLQTDFWKHGLAGIIDILDKIKPCVWYGKLHPFEVEFVAGNRDPAMKEFTNLIIMSNNVMPESVHYTVIGDAYSFSKDKRNMYFRLEATKAFYQQNGSDILYDHRAFESDFYNKVGLINVNNSLDKSDSMYLRQKAALSDLYRATIFPLKYSRLDTFNEIEDYYKKATSKYYNYDYPNLSGGEVNFNWREDSFTLTNHVKVRDIITAGRARGNAEFKNGSWAIQIPPFVILLRNETWQKVPPINVTNAPVPKDMYPVKLREAKRANGKVSLQIAEKTAREFLNTEGLDPDILVERINRTETPIAYTELLDSFVPLDVYNAGYLKTDNLDVTNWGIYNSHALETRIMDNMIKIKVRYSGDKLVLLKGIATVYEPRV